MDTYQLEAFEAVVTHGSFARAAADLHLTQPAVTRQIASLESSLRTRLFERLGRGVRITSSGEALHLQAGAIVRLVAAAREEMADIEA
ncbi:MAG: LysR family transcriptional regulator [Chthonomonadales bacterium]|nr:LysR family transcriptional regulator [Chthonomonadales bacterium]